MLERLEATQKVEWHKKEDTCAPNLFAKVTVVGKIN